MASDWQEQLEKARAAKEKAVKLYGDWELVNGIGISRVDGAYSVKINLLENLGRQLKIDDEIDGVPVVLKVVGKVKKQEID
jgi:hypothetical protein